MVSKHDRLLIKEIDVVFPKKKIVNLAWRIGCFMDLVFKVVRFFKIPRMSSVISVINDQCIHCHWCSFFDIFLLVGNFFDFVTSCHFCRTWKQIRRIDAGRFWPFKLPQSNKNHCWVYLGRFTNPNPLRFFLDCNSIICANWGRNHVFVKILFFLLAVIVFPIKFLSISLGLTLEILKNKS